MTAEDRPTIDVLVESARGPHNRYAYDPDTARIRLVEVVDASDAFPFDEGTLPGTLGEDGRPLRVLLLVSRSTFAGCLVAARPLGLVEAESGDVHARRLVAVATADAGLAALGGPGDLTAEHAAAVERWVLHESGGGRLSWRGADEAAAVIRHARQAARLARAEADRRVAGPPGWRALWLAANGRTARETDANTEAERGVHLLTNRFQLYLDECLLPDERILVRIPRPPLALGGPLRRRRLNEGVLVVTDRQLLFLTDAVPPGESLTRWGYGYVARTVALGRLHDAEAIRMDGRAVLTVGVEASGGIERLSFDFRPEALHDLGRTAALLRGFLPGLADRRLRRVAAVADEPPRLDAAREPEPPAEEVDPLRRRLADVVATEAVIAQALAPAWPPKRLPARLVAVTAQQVLLVPRDGPVEGHTLAEISSLELRNSLVGCSLTFVLPRVDEAARVVVDFDFPSAPAFVRLHRAVRQLLAAPVPRAATEAASPDHAVFAEVAM